MISASVNEKKIVKVPLSYIDTTINVNPRTHLIMENIEKLVESNGFPEIHLGYYNGTLIIVDGYHRHKAAEKLEQEYILAYITEYHSLDELKEDAFKENVNHGIKLSEYEIASWIYENFLRESKKNPSTSLSSFSRKCKVPERRGSALFKWYLIHKEILEDDEIEVKRATDCEELYSLVYNAGEISGQISEDFKVDFRLFYNQYAGILTKSELRQAINYKKEGLDYNTEMEKIKLAEIEKAKIEAEKEEEEKDPYSRQEIYFPDDAFLPGSYKDEATLDDENEDDSSEAKQHPNELIANLMERSEELNDINEEISIEMEKKNDKKNNEIVCKMIKSLSESIMSLSILQKRKKSNFTYENLKDLECIMDRLQEVIDELDVEELRKEFEGNTL